MMKMLSFLAILLIQFFHQQVVGTPPPALPANHFLMVIQWTRAYCKKNQSIRINRCPKNYEKLLHDKFYIHGLWPKPVSSASVRSGSAFDLKNLPSLAKDRTRLTTNWPSAKSAGMKGEGTIIAHSIRFWTHEWEDHGRYQTLGQRDYFNFVLDRYDDLSYIHTDVVNKFHTMSKVGVRVRNIVQYIESKHKVVTNISCLPYGIYSGKKMLFEIYFNITLDGRLQNLTDVSNLHRNPCPDHMSTVFL